MRGTIGLLALAALALIGMVLLSSQLITPAIPSQPSQPTITPAVEPQPEQTPEVREPALVAIAEWSGADNRVTAPFTVNKKPWVIEWSFVPGEPLAETYINYLGIEVVRTTGQLVALPANLANAESRREGSSYVYEEGRFYLDITCMDGAWSVRVLAYE